MKKYRKKPVVVEAVQFKNHEMKHESICNCGDKPLPHIHTLEGDMIVNVGDYIIKGIKGEFYPCKNDVFLLTYEPVEDAP